jgi:hypothetical protein
MTPSSIDLLNSTEAAISASVAHNIRGTEKNRQSSFSRIFDSDLQLLSCEFVDSWPTRNPSRDALRVYTGRRECKNEKATRQLGSLFFKGE